MGTMRGAAVAAAALLVGAAAPAPAANAAPRPHIVVLLTDNMGWANVGFHRPPSLPAREIHTPNVDKLAASGLILDRHYTYKFCSPSRSSFLSGRLPFHVNIYNGISPRLQLYRARTLIVMHSCAQCRGAQHHF
jgi:arylsulfatase B